MAPLARRVVIAIFFIVVGLYTFNQFSRGNGNLLPNVPGSNWPGAEMPSDDDDDGFIWAARPQQFPVKNPVMLPTGEPAAIPTIQHKFPPETDEQSSRREQRKQVIRAAMVHSWKGYRDHAWGADEVTPLSGQANSKFGDWGATLVDSLDTLWIMNMDEEFAEAVEAVNKIDFTKCELSELNLFETTIRYLGGLLGAYDLSKERSLLDKARELGEMLYAAFDTENRMPISRWTWYSAKHGENNEPASSVLLAEVASLSLEFTRLSQLTGDDKFYDAIARITDSMYQQQNRSNIPGLWPIIVSPRDNVFDADTTFTIGGMADSAYEYLPKEWLLLVGRSPEYRYMYDAALAAIKEYLVFQPLVPIESYQRILSSGAPPLMVGTIRNSGGDRHFMAEGQHLACFAGGMVALGARIFDKPEDMRLAERLVAGCIWSYETSPTGIGPEKWNAFPCKLGLDAVTEGVETGGNNPGNCAWSRGLWVAEIDRRLNGAGSKSKDPNYLESYIRDHRLPEGVTQAQDRRYLLRPEAIESIFVLYRITGDERLREHAWLMWTSIDKVAHTSIAYASVADVLDPETTRLDSMESFWPAETLKYFYLLFSDPELVSLDEFVFNTEAHPLRWRRDHGHDF